MAGLPNRRASESGGRDAPSGPDLCLRHKVLVEGRSHVAKELGISRLTVKKYLTEPVSIQRERKPRARPSGGRSETQGLVTAP